MPRRLFSIRSRTYHSATPCLTRRVRIAVAFAVIGSSLAKRAMSRCSRSRSIRVASAVMRESRSMLSTMTASKVRPLAAACEEVGQAAGAGEADGEACAVGAGAALVELLAAALDVPVAGDDLAARLLDDALAGGELPRKREGWVLCVFGGDASVEGELHAVLLRWMRHQAARRISTACRKRRTIAASCLERSSAASRPCAVATTISTAGRLSAVSRTRPMRSATRAEDRGGARASFREDGLARRVIGALGAPRRAGRHERSEGSRPEGGLTDGARSASSSATPDARDGEIRLGGLLLRSRRRSAGSGGR